MPDGDIQSDKPEPRRRPVIRPDDDESLERAESRRRRRREDDDDDYDDERTSSGDEVVQALIPYKNPLALASYYCGVFSFIPCLGNALGPTALILGILGMRYSSRHPTAKGMGHAITGIVLGSLTSLVWWGFVIFALIGGFMSSRR